VEAIDEIFLEEDSGKFTAAHEPDVFAGIFAELADEGRR
jgi:hypothetical protein